MSTIDLHIHTNISTDGSHSVQEIIEFAKENNVNKIAITDHNSIRAVKEAIELGEKNNIQVIPGIEIDCVYENINLHMTAYYIDYNDPRYSELEEYYYQTSKKNTWQAVYTFMNAFHLNISDDILNEISINGILVPEDFADYLLTHDEYKDLRILDPYRKGGTRSDNPNVNFYWDYFSQGKLAYVKEEKIDVTSIIHLIHDTGGIAVVAHPGVNFKNQDEKLQSLLKKVDGIEVFSSYHSDEQIDKYLEFANQYKLKITCGSDFHGHHKPMIQIGKIPGKDIESYINW